MTPKGEPWRRVVNRLASLCPSFTSVSEAEEIGVRIRLGHHERAEHELGSPSMPDDAKRRAAGKAVKAAQRQFDRESAATQKARRKAFAQAQKEGLTLREIGEEVGLHRSRIAQIIKGK